MLSAFPPYTLGLRLSYVQIFVCLVVGFLSVLSVVFCLSSQCFFVCLVVNSIACLVRDILCPVSRLRYNDLATLALAAFGHVRALCARCRPFEPTIALIRGGVM